jgi:hypothetical protein
MTADEVELYMRLLGQATAAFVPPDATFIVIVTEAGQAHYAANVERAAAISELRAVADQLGARN